MQRVTRRGRFARFSPTQAPDEDGFALISVLVALVIIAVLIGTQLSQSRTQAQFARNIVDATHAQLLAESGLRLIDFSLSHPELGTVPDRNGGSVVFELPGGRVEVWVTDERGKVDLNRAPRALVEALLNELGFQDRSLQLAAAVVDFRDADHQVTPGGGEDAEYAALGLVHGAMDGPFLSIYDLSQTLGFADVDIDQLSNFFTVHSQQRSPLVSAAPMEVRRALGYLSASELAAASPTGYFRVSPSYPVALFVLAVTDAGARAELRHVMLRDRYGNAILLTP